MVNGYDPKTSSWISKIPQGSPPSVKRHGHICQVVGDKVFIFGGRSLHYDEPRGIVNKKYYSGVHVLDLSKIIDLLLFLLFYLTIIWLYLYRSQFTNYWLCKNAGIHKRKSNRYELPGNSIKIKVKIYKKFICVIILIILNILPTCFRKDLEIYKPLDPSRYEMVMKYETLQLRTVLSELLTIPYFYT